MRRTYEGVRIYAPTRLADDEYSPLWDEAELEFASGSLRILHTPGTHLAHVLLYAKRSHSDCRRLRAQTHYAQPSALAGPHRFLKRFPSLAEYLVSLARLRSFAPTLVLWWSR